MCLTNVDNDVNAQGSRGSRAGTHLARDVRKIGFRDLCSLFAALLFQDCWGLAALT